MKFMEFNFIVGLFCLVCLLGSCYIRMARMHNDLDGIRERICRIEATLLELAKEEKGNGNGQ